MNLIIVRLLSITLLVLGCKATALPSTNDKNSKQKNKLPNVIYAIDPEEDNTYEIIELAKDDEPQAIQGKDQWLRDFYGSLRYPASAREKGISGIVILNVMVDKSGQVTTVDILKSLSIECDEAAKKSFLKSTAKGYSILMHANRPVNYKMEVPVGFWLH